MPFVTASSWTQCPFPLPALKGIAVRSLMFIFPVVFFMHLYLYASVWLLKYFATTVF